MSSAIRTSTTGSLSAPGEFSDCLPFNEGYKASQGDELVRRDLCEEAIRLATLLVEHPSSRRSGLPHPQILPWVCSQTRSACRTSRSARSNRSAGVRGRNINGVLRSPREREPWFGLENNLGLALSARSVVVRFSNRIDNILSTSEREPCLFPCGSRFLWLHLTAPAASTPRTWQVFAAV